MSTRKAKHMQEMKWNRQVTKTGLKLEREVWGESKNIRERGKTCLRQSESKRDNEGGIAREREGDTEM